jgi:hypothetical protein
MPVRLPVALLALAVGLTVGLVAVAVVARVPGDAHRARVGGSGSAVQVPEERFALEVLHGWDRQRAAAWAAGDPAALARLYVPGSPAGATDVALLRRYAARELSVRGIRMQLLRVRVLVARPGRVALEVTDRLTSAVAVRAGDVTASRPLPADAASTRLLELRRVGGRWLMARVSRPGSASGR